MFLGINNYAEFLDADTTDKFEQVEIDFDNQNEIKIIAIHEKGDGILIEILNNKDSIAYKGICDAMHRCKRTGKKITNIHELGWDSSVSQHQYW